ncbi:hypothetical protein D1B33_15255 [Lysinibacillus yapensis]|uniref:Uncharacterized protein n=1 Tax=Ureibacillus yapensis TaxID=2304605 RepID=A0A396S4F9_9BACL|nr:hypothetical protein [Lysinibacillus yapensis]RHW33403.1 hypothetical protein D1B33_15255 [Lysinibacillus yapensis]
MMHFKKLYVDEILKQSEYLRELGNIDSQLQQVLINAGRQKNIYPTLEIKSPFNPTYKNQYNGVYLQLSLGEIKRLITGQYTEDDVDYLNKFANKKVL